MVGSGGPTQNLKLYFATNHWRGMLACTWLLHVSASFQMMRWLEPVNGNSISDLFVFSSLVFRRFVQKLIKTVTVVHRLRSATL